MESAICYIRVSTGDQENSLELQEKTLIQYCSIKNLRIKEIIIDEDVSGFKELYKRKNGYQLQQLLSSTKNIIATKPDRLFRNLKDALITVDQWNSDNIALHIVDMGGAQFRTDTAIGRLMFSTIISFSEFERNITGERVKGILGDRKDSRRTYCRSILGFNNVNGKLIPNPSEQTIIQQIFSLSDTLGHTDIARTINQAGHRTKTGLPFRDTTIKYILNNQIYKEHLKIAS
ncbi:MAG: recombinase family protein [Bacteroidota bacterium]